MRACSCFNCQLQRLTDRVIEERVMTSKFKQLAADIAGDLQNFNNQADELAAKREDLRVRGEKVFAKHREHQTDLAEGIAAMEQAVADLEGSNSKNGEGSDDMSDSSFQKG